MGNSPTNYTDPLGLAQQAVTAGSGLSSAFTGNSSGCGGLGGMCHSVNSPTNYGVATTYARLAKGVYEKDFRGADGYKLTAGPFATESGLNAALYTHENGANVLAFAGTSPTSAANWGANLSQAFGFESEQYNEAIDLAVSFNESTGGNIHFTGHSLGGGIASAAAIVTGGNATVFNADGVHDNTLNGHSRSNGSVTHYSSSFDVLQVGNALTPASVPGKQISLGAAGLHGMGGVCAAMSC